MTFLTAASGSLLSRLKDWDMAFFLKINTEWTGSFGDFIMPLMRDQRTWYPLYAALLIYVIWKFKWKAIPYILIGALTVVITDQLSSSVLKGFFGRTRPCHEEQLIGLMKLRVGYCPQSGSFTSSHAVNHFGLAAFFFFTLKPYLKNWRWLFFLWAGIICYAQVYVGVHYPGDVTGGGLLGILLGWLTSLVFIRYFNFGIKRNKPDTKDSLIE